MEKKEKYEAIYEKVVEYEKRMHRQNQRRIKVGLWCLWIVPLIFLFFLFWTDSNKVVFLIFWIVSLFVLAAYLIGIEYMDFNIQERLRELVDEKDREVDSLIGKEFEQVESNLATMIQKLDDTLNSKVETQRREKGAEEDKDE